MNYRLAVCDDDKAYANFIASLAKQWAASIGAKAEIEQFSSAQAFLFRYEERKDFDILLLDIEMPGMDGVSLAKTLRRENEDIQIVFITGYTDYIAEGYEVSALHYLMKPVDEEKLTQVLTKAASRRNEPMLTLELPGETTRIPFRKIRYLEVLHNYVTVHGDQNYSVKRPLGELEKELDEQFFRVSRSYILNLSYIRRVTRTEVELMSGERIPLPRGQYEKLNRAIIQQI